LLFADDNPPENMHPIFAYCSKQSSDIFSIPLGGIRLFGYPMRVDEWARYWQTNGRPFQERQDTLYWIGGSSEYRQHIVSKIQCIPNVNAQFSSNPSNFVPLINQGVYKYLLEMQGIGWSARLIALLWMGSVVFILDRDIHEFWFKDNFVPWVHYVPVQHNAEDLHEVFTKVQNMPDKGEHIAQACRQKTIEILTENFMKEHFACMIHKHVTRFGICTT
jgi:Glycosyl transferase family 90